MLYIFCRLDHHYIISQIELIDVGHYQWSMSSFCCISMIFGAHDRPWQMSGHHAKTMNFKSNLTTYFTKVVGHTTPQWISIDRLHISLKWLEIPLIRNVCSPAVFLSSVYENQVLNCDMYEHFCLWPYKAFEHNIHIFVLAWSLYILSTVFVP